MNLRNIAERMSRGVVLRRRMPKQFGRLPLYVSPAAGGLRFWRFNLRRTDPTLFRLVEELVRPGMTVWDIGANLGLFSFAAAFRAGASGFVLAVEPDVDNAALLLRTRHRNAARIAPLSVLAAAIGARGRRTATLHIAARSRSANSLLGSGGGQMGGTLESRTVPLFCLDDLLDEFPAPAVVKMDVENAEAAALSGASRLLGEIRPTVVVEVAPDDANRVAVADVFRKFNYQMFDADAPPGKRAAHESPPWNTLALPR